MRVVALAIALCLVGCGSGDDEPGPIEAPPTACTPGEWQREDGACIPAGLPPDMPCPPGEWQRGDACIPAGVPPDGCGEGFVHDGVGGCDPILPSEPCPPGLMAVPGETTCREVATCAAGSWGDIPVEPNTEYVDASYAGMDSDGSALRPWTTIQAGVDSAAPDAIVAIAEGSYVEDVLVSGNAVRVWGVCPARVEIVATGSAIAAVRIFGNADGTEVRNLAIRGDRTAVISSGSLDVLLERVWLHDNASRGVGVESSLGRTSVVVRASLLEKSVVGVFQEGSEATVESSVVRDTSGQGVYMQDNPTTLSPATFALRASLVERGHDHGIFAEHSLVTVENSVVRDTQPNEQGGRGVSVQAQSMTGAPSTLMLRTSVVEQNHEVGVYVGGSTATVESSVIRDTQPDVPEFGGRGVAAESHLASSTPAVLLLRTSLVERNYGLGMFVDGSEATVESSVVRDTQPDPLGKTGRGVSVQATVMTGVPSKFLLRTSVVEQSHEVGVFVESSEANLEASVVRGTQTNATGSYGRGVSVQPRPAMGMPTTLTILASLVEQSHEVGVFVHSSVATIESSIVRDTLDNLGTLGDGLVGWSELGPASVIVNATHVDRSTRAALTAFAAHAAISGSIFTCQAIDLDSETYLGTAAKLENLGGNLCGCPEPTEECHSVSANVAPPPPLEPAPSP